MHAIKKVGERQHNLNNMHLSIIECMQVIISSYQHWAKIIKVKSSSLLTWLFMQGITLFILRQCLNSINIVTIPVGNVSTSKLSKTLRARKPLASHLSIHSVGNLVTVIIVTDVRARGLRLG